MVLLQKERGESNSVGDTLSYFEQQSFTIVNYIRQVIGAKSMAVVFLTWHV